MRNILIGVTGALLLASLASVMVGLFGQSEEWMLVAVGVACPIAFIAPILMRQVSVYDPVNLMFAYVMIGCTGAAVYMAFGSGSRHDYLMAGESAGYFAIGGIWVMAGLFLAGLSNALTTFRFPVEQLFKGEVVGERIVPIGALAILLSVVATVTYVAQTGGLAGLSNLSTKRMLIIDAGGGETVKGTGAYLRAAAQITYPVALMVLASVRGKLSFIGKLGLFALITAACITPFMSSARSTVLYMLIGLCMVGTQTGQLKPRQLIALGAAGLLLFSAMSMLRSISRNLETQSNPIVSLVESGNGLSLIGTSLVVQRVPDRMPFMMGSSYLSWITAPIPRSMWPDKPEVAVGVEIKKSVLGETRSVRGGRPPSFMAEGYLNFGVLGFVLASLAAGAILRVFWNSFGPLLGRNTLATAAYALFIFHLCDLANAGFSQVVVRLLTDLLVLSIATFALTSGRRAGGRVRQPQLRRSHA